MNAIEKTATLFFVLSGEHPTLPFSELKSILEAEGYKYRVLERLIQVLRVKTNVDSIKSVASRAATTKICGIEIFTCNSVTTQILEQVKNSSLKRFINEGESFAVRVLRIRGSAPHIARLELEKKLGKLIFNMVDGVIVNLRSPQKTFFGVLTGNKFVFGLKKIEVPKSLLKRNPKNRPFSHPTTMTAKLAKCMVNLARPKVGELVLDPFCGTASILVEAGLIGCRIMGLDVQHHMVVGSLKNLHYYKINPEAVIVADARQLPITRVDCVVTDPPYGRAATTLGFKTQKIIKDFLLEIENKLPRGGRICIASPKSVGLSKIGVDLGLNHLESHFYYVHRSLTREIAVFERT